MKTLSLFACLAVPVAAAAAELKDPATVARDWNQTIEQAREPMTPPTGLLGQSTKPPAPPAPVPFQYIEPLARRGPRSLPPRSRLYDAPNYRVPDVLPDNLPPGAKPWEFEGRIYWLIPINPATGK